MTLNTRHFAPGDPAGDGSGAGGSESTFDRSKLPSFLQKFEGNNLTEVLTKADQSYWNLVNHQKETEGKLRSTLEKAAQYDKITEQMGGGPARRPESAISRVAQEAAIDPALLAQAIVEGAAAVLSQTLSPALGEFSATQELANEMGEDFARIRPEVKKWLEETPAAKLEFDTMVGAYPKQAWELAIRRWGATQAGNAGKPGGAKRGDAGFVGGRPSGGRPERGTADPEKLKLATEYFNAYGDSGPMKHERFKGTSIEAAVQQAAQFLENTNL